MKYGLGPIFLAAVAFLIMIPCSWLIRAASGADRQHRSPIIKTAFPSDVTAAGKEIIRHYAWKDINSTKIIGQRGDGYIIDGGPKTETCRLVAIIDATRLNVVMESFGVPESWMHFRYSSEQDRRRKMEELQHRIARRGFVFSDIDNSITIDYGWVVEQSVSDMKDTAVGLKEEAMRAGYENTRQLNGMITSFVQSMRYWIPPEKRRNHDGQDVFISGVTMPLETLYRGQGDCDTKSILFASILKNFGNANVIFLKGNNHMFAGIRMEPRMYEQYILIKGEKYVLVELTSPWRLGHVPQEHLHALRLKKLEVVPLY